MASNNYRVTVQAVVDPASLQAIQKQLNALQTKINIGGGAGGGCGGGKSATNSANEYAQAIRNQQGAFQRLEGSLRSSNALFQVHRNDLDEITKITQTYANKQGDVVTETTGVSRATGELATTMKNSAGALDQSTKSTREYNTALNAQQGNLGNIVSAAKQQGISYNTVTDSQNRLLSVTTKQTDANGMLVSSLSKFDKATGTVKTQTNNLGTSMGNLARGTQLSTEAIQKQQPAFQEQIQKLQNLNAVIKTTENSTGQITGVSGKYTDSLGRQAVEVSKLSSKTGEMVTKIDRTSNTLDVVKDKTKNWTTEIVNNLAKSIQWALAMSMVYAPLRAIKEGIQYITDLNKELTDIQIVTGMTGAETNVLAGDYNKLANQLGATTLEVAKSSLEWYRQGKTAAETSELIKQSMIMSKLANLDAAQSTEYLTSIINGFKLKVEDVEGVISKLVNLDNNFATSTGEIAEAMQRSASAAQLSGVSLDELASYITVVSSVTRKSAIKSQ